MNSNLALFRAFRTSERALRCTSSERAQLFPKSFFSPSSVATVKGSKCIQLPVFKFVAFSVLPTPTICDFGWGLTSAATCGKLEKKTSALVIPKSAAFLAVKSNQAKNISAEFCTSGTFLACRIDSLGKEHENLFKDP